MFVGMYVALFVCLFDSKTFICPLIKFISLKNVFFFRFPAQVRTENVDL